MIINMIVTIIITIIVIIIIIIRHFRYRHDYQYCTIVEGTYCVLSVNGKCIRLVFNSGAL